MSASLALSPSNAVSVRFAVSHFRYRQSPETSDITFVQIVQSLRFTTFVILRNPFVIIATTFASHGRSSNYKNGHSKRPIDESRSQKSRQNTRFIYSLTAGRHHSNLHNTSHNEVPDLVWCFPTWFYDVFRGNNVDSPMTQHKVVNAGWRRIERLSSEPDHAGLNVTPRSGSSRIKCKRVNSTRGQTRFLTCLARVTCLVRNKRSTKLGAVFY